MNRNTMRAILRKLNSQGVNPHKMFIGNYCYDLFYEDGNGGGIIRRRKQERGMLPESKWEFYGTLEEIKARTSKYEKNCNK